MGVPAADKSPLKVNLTVWLLDVDDRTSAVAVTVAFAPPVREAHSISAGFRWFMGICIFIFFIMLGFSRVFSASPV